MIGSSTGPITSPIGFLSYGNSWLVVWQCVQQNDFNLPETNHLTRELYVFVSYCFFFCFDAAWTVDLSAPYRGCLGNDLCPYKKFDFVIVILRSVCSCEGSILSQLEFLLQPNFIEITHIRSTNYIRGVKDH